MSNFLAIATVTAALRRLVLDAVQSDVPGAQVTTLRPAEPGAASGIVSPGVNLFLYQVTPIGPLRNEALPARRSSGAVAQRPVVALELHYLVSFYGNEADYESQRLLGSAVARIAAEPVLTRTRIQATLADPLNPFLASSNLGDQVDSIKLTPISLSLDELSRVWSVLLQTRYTLSVVWRASAILVEPNLRAVIAPPVLKSNLVAVPIALPEIDRIVSIVSANAAILPGSGIRIIGARLANTSLQVLVGGITVVPTSANDVEIVVTVPLTLHPGPQTVLVRHGVTLGEPPETRTGFDSSPAEFILHPAIAHPGPGYALSLANVTGGGLTRSADLQATLVSPVGRNQHVNVELLSPADASQQRTFAALPLVADSTVIVFHLTEIAVGSYLVRLRVDGAESILDLDTTSASPTFGQPIAPKITVA